MRRLKRRASIPGIVVAIFAVIVAGIAVAALNYHPAPPPESHSVPPTPASVTPPPSHPPVPAKATQPPKPSDGTPPTP